jgi:hypothetical protein
MTKSVLALILPLALAACATTRAVREPVPVTAGTERAVWEALIRQAYISDDTKVVLLSTELQSGGDEWNWGPKPRGIPSDAWQAFVLAFGRGGTVAEDLDVGVPLDWNEPGQVEEVPTDETDADDGWSGFNERFPGNSGLVSISRVGFSRDGRTAVVYGTVWRASLSASQDLFVLRKTVRGWRLVLTHNCATA